MSWNECKELSPKYLTRGGKIFHYWKISFSCGSGFKGTVSQDFLPFNLIHDQLPHLKKHRKCTLLHMTLGKVYTFRVIKLGKCSLSMFHNADSNVDGLHFPSFISRKCALFQDDWMFCAMTFHKENGISGVQMTGRQP